MAKKTAAESDETRLKKKLSTTGKDKASGDAAVRALRKRLKREQRRRRALALRKKHAAGSKGDAKASA
ncbi:MAG: hypothetical protein RI101_08995 [Nitrospira sp.]|jgi:hypothetical protein|nr:hypothetical protein [Nitrospira sp.]